MKQQDPALALPEGVVKEAVLAALEAGEFTPVEKQQVLDMLAAEPKEFTRAEQRRSVKLRAVVEKAIKADLESFNPKVVRSPTQIHSLFGGKPFVSTSAVKTIVNVLLMHYSVSPHQLLLARECDTGIWRAAGGVFEGVEEGEKLCCTAFYAELIKLKLG
jgi:hypothetical protein